LIWIQIIDLLIGNGTFCPVDSGHHQIYQVMKLAYRILQQNISAR